MSERSGCLRPKELVPPVPPLRVWWPDPFPQRAGCIALRLLMRRSRSSPPSPPSPLDGLTADLLQHARRGDDGNARSSSSALSMRVWRRWAMTWARRPSGLRGLTFQGAASCRRGGRQTCILLAVRSSIIRCRWNRRLRAEMRERLVAGRTWRAFGERARHLVVSCFGLFCLV